MRGRGLRADQTRGQNGGSAMHVMRTRGGYRINLDGSISFAEEVLREREQESAEADESEDE